MGSQYTINSSASLRESPKSAKAFSKKAMTKDILIVPGDDFGCPDYLRLCYCVSYDTVVRSLPIFQALIEAE